MADNTIEIVVKADGRQALANLERLRQAFIETENRASTSTSKMRGELEQLGRTADRVLRRELTSALNVVGVSTGLFAGGLVAGLVGAGKALADFGRSGLQLHYLAQELNVSAQSLTRWRLAGQAAGLSSDQAANDVQTAMKKLQDLGRRGFHAELYQELITSTADRTGHDLAMALMEQVRSGGPEQGFRFLLQKLQQYTKEGNTWGVSTIERVIGLSRGWGRAVENIDKFGKVTVVSAEDAAKFQLQITLLGAELDALKTELGNELLPTFTDLARTLREWLQTAEGKKFQQDLIDLAAELKKLDWKQIGQDVATTVRIISAIFVEGKAVIEAFISTVTLGFVNLGRMNEYRNTWLDQKRREEQRAGLHGPEAKRMIERWHPRNVPIQRRLPGSQGGMGGDLGLGDIGGGVPRTPFPRRGGRASSVFRFSGGGDGGGEDATEFSSVNRRRDTTENLTDQMRDVTDEVRRLNDLLRGGGDVARTPGGGAGDMGPTGGGPPGGGRGPRRRDGTNPQNPQNPPQTTSSPQTNPPPSTGQDPAQMFQQLGTAAGIQGAPGGPSGRALTAAERKAASQVPGGGGADTPLPGGTGSSAIYQKLLAAYQNSSVIGTIPADGARFGFKTGSAEEWARFAMIIAASESDYNPKTAVNNAREQSFGIFQYNHPQVPGGNAFDVDASVKQFVKDSESSMKTHGNLGPGSMLYRRFSTIQKTPPQHRHRQAEEAIKKAQRDPKQPAQPQPGAAPQLGPGALPPPGTVPPGSRTTTGVQPEAPVAQPPGPITGDPKQRSDAGLVHPVQGGTILSVHGDPRPGGVTGKHQGLDIAAKSGTYIGATSNQTIRDVGWIGGKYGKYGWGVKTVDAQGQEHVYAHMLHDPRVTHGLKIGQALVPGQQIGQVGNSGNAKDTPSHLHYEVRPKVGAYAQSYDPRKMLPPFPGEKGYQRAAPSTRAPAPAAPSQQVPQIGVPPILQPRQGIPRSGGIMSGVGGDAARDGRIQQMRNNATGDKRADDASADRKTVDSSLVAQMSQQVMSGRAAIDIDVGAAVAKANGDADKNLFNKTRSKSAPQMPNTVTNGDNDSKSGSDEGAED